RCPARACAPASRRGATGATEHRSRFWRYTLQATAADATAADAIAADAIDDDATDDDATDNDATNDDATDADAHVGANIGRTSRATGRARRTHLPAVSSLMLPGRERRGRLRRRERSAQAKCRAPHLPSPHGCPARACAPASRRGATGATEHRSRSAVRAA